MDYAKLKLLNPKATREHLGDGNFAGVYEKPDAVMAELWQVAVEETRELIVGPWGLKSEHQRAFKVFHFR